MNETESLIIVAKKLRFISDEQFGLIKSKLEKKRRLLGGLLNHISKRLKGE